MGAETGSDVMGSAPTRRPAEETEFNALERGVIRRARDAGFRVEMIHGLGPLGSSTRVTGVRHQATPSLGLLAFSMTRLNGKADYWIKFRYWPSRASTLSEIRAELDFLNELEHHR